MTETPELLSARQIAARLNVTERAVRRWMKLGTLPSVRPIPGTRLVRVPASALTFCEQRPPERG